MSKVEGPFWVTFNVAGRPTKRQTPDHERWDIEDLEKGFWITKEHHLCRPSQGHYFIPPSQIVLIEKRHVAPDPL